MAGKRSVSVGDVFINKQGTSAVVLEYLSSNRVKVKFQDLHGDVRFFEVRNLKSGNFRNYYDKTIYGVGFIGKGEHLPYVNKERTEAYNHWSKSMERCYSESYQKVQPSYVGCTVSDEWHNFQVFGDWKESNEYYQLGFQLDKDILVKGNKIYSPDTCCFLPPILNSILGDSKVRRGCSPKGTYYDKDRDSYLSSISLNNVKTFLGYYKSPEEAFYTYKEAKEKYIKEVATTYKDQIDSRAYEALMNYEVSIDD